MSSEWRSIKFSELIREGILQIGDGYRAKNDELGGAGLIFLRSAHVKDSHIDFSGVEYFRDENLARFKAKVAEAGDVVITTKGNSTGRVSFVTRDMPAFVYSPHLSFWRSLASDRLVPGFLRAWSSSQDFHTQLKKMCYSTDMAPYLSLTDQRELRIPVPPLAEQRVIASVLDVIERRLTLLRETNATLDAIAQVLFKSWFVDFDPVHAKLDGRVPEGMDEATAALFPGHFDEFDVGVGPSGWKKLPFTDTVHVIGGGTPKTSIEEYWNGSIPWFSVVDAPLTNDVFVVNTKKSITQAGLENSSTKLLPEGTTIISARGTVGRLALTGREMAMNQSCYALRGKSNDAYFTYFSTYRLVEALKQRSHGSVFDTITTETLRSVFVIYPSAAVIDAFERTIEACMVKIKTNLMYSQTLVGLRDTLLPRLISGQLRLPEATALLDEVAA